MLKTMRALESGRFIEDEIDFPLNEFSINLN